MVILNGYTWKNEKCCSVFWIYEEFEWNTRPGEPEWLFWYSCRHSNRHELSRVKFKLMRVWGDVRFTQWTRRDQCFQKGEIFKELVILLAPSVHGWITTCFVCCLLVAQQVLAPYSGGYRRHFYSNVCFKRMNITLKCFQNFAYVPFVKFCV